MQTLISSNEKINFIYKHIKNEKEFLKAGYNANQKYKLSIRTSLTKINIYRLAYLCKMNMSELVQFMIICETSFNPGSKLDMFMIKYFRLSSTI